MEGGFILVDWIGPDGMGVDCCREGVQTDRQEDGRRWGYKLGMRAALARRDSLFFI